MSQHSNYGDFIDFGFLEFESTTLEEVLEVRSLDLTDLTEEVLEPELGESELIFD